MSLRYLTNGDYNLSTGLYDSEPGSHKYYLATDNLQKSQYQGLLLKDLMDIITDRHLHFDSSTKTGIVFHLMGALSEFGKLGLTCIGDSPQQAEDLYNQVVEVLDRETIPSSDSTWQSCTDS